ncbi:MAG TPA: hypothetical protein VMM60_03285 [Ilumatobacter sp.]|nr:hypothetical protein [Ilumatobacter sp.]
MTEIPEHLLKRSRERRSALGLGGDDASGTPAAAASAPAKVETAAATPAVAAPTGRSAVPAPAAAPKPKPDSPVVVAYKRRKRVPFWAMTALSLMPVWGFMYARSVTASPQVVEGALGLGDEIYASCSSCHGGDGQGVAGLGYAFSDGEIVESFPHIEDQIRYVYFGTAGYNLAGIDIAGNPDREGGAHITGARGLMPNWGSETGGELTDYELLGVVCHERYTLGGVDPAGEFVEEYEHWCSEESPIFEALEGGATTLLTLHEFDDTVMPIGPEPVAGSPAGE